MPELMFRDKLHVMKFFGSSHFLNFLSLDCFLFTYFNVGTSIYFRKCCCISLNSFLHIVINTNVNYINYYQTIQLCVSSNGFESIGICDMFLCRLDAQKINSLSLTRIFTNWQKLWQ